MPSPSFPFPFPLLFLLLFVVFLPSSSSTHSFHHDAQSLLAFKKGITSDPNNSMAAWTPALPFCNWTAVTCSRRHRNRVVALDLNGMDLIGTISASLGNLSFLRSLNLSNNMIYGPIPPQLGALFRLRWLWLHHNQLDGNIPRQLSDCRHLVSVAVSYNNLSGNVPGELGSLPHLQQLYLGVNSLTGTIPSSIGNLSALIELYISENNLIGSIPQELGLLTHLQNLFLYQNELSGSIPTSLSNISSLSILSISLNNLKGHIPSEFGVNLNNLSVLSLWGNQLSGNIPNSIGNCSKLQILFLAINKLTGSVPIELGKLSFLENLNLRNNQLHSGSTTTMHFLVALTNCSRLHTLILENNKLSGILPFAIGKLSTNLSILSLWRNMIEGKMPPHIGNLSSLTFLDLSRNLLNGSIPPLGNLKKIERLYLADNKFEGNIPDDFEQLQHLGLLDVSKNMLSGKIPNSLAPLKQLRRVFLHHNKLSGSIPPNLGNCINLELLDMSHNMFNGSIPREIAKLSNLQFYLNLSWNLLQGSLPMEIGKISMVQAIDVSSNQLTGAIPATIGSCSELQLLNLSRNSFQDPIPDSLGNLQSLMNIDLSFNFLSSTIPITLQKLKMLQCLNLSFNNLTGEIAEGGLFPNQTIVISLIGNPSLCGPQILKLHACPTPKSHFSFVKKVLFSVGGAIVAFILCCLLFKFLWRGNMHMKSFDFSQAIFEKILHRRISFQELFIATNGFIEANLLGTGSFGSVYKGILNDGMLVAVKVFQLQNNQVAKSFNAECSVLKMVRHRNLVRIITSCSNLHFKGLVFQFMSNGSLHKHLYPRRDENNGEDMCQLGLKARINIAIDVAHAMEYLHHYSYVQVVHCDIKPSNVLLDEDMTGHVTDFGLAKLIGVASNDSLTSILALKGSMGYIAPEYGLSEIVSTKGDVYSYGILLLEMVTRKRPTCDLFIGELSLHKWVSRAFPNKVKEAIDPNLVSELDRGEFQANNFYKCLLCLLWVGLLCSKDSPDERPTMRDVVIVLENLKDDLVENTIALRRQGRSMSNLLGDTNTKKEGAPTSYDQSSSTF